MVPHTLQQLNPDSSLSSRNIYNGTNLSFYQALHNLPKYNETKFKEKQEQEEYNKLQEGTGSEFKDIHAFLYIHIFVY